MNSHETLRSKLLSTALKMNDSGLNQGTAGNLSVRADEGFYITPSGMPYNALKAQDMVWMNLSGEFEGSLKPSSEWRFHRDIYVQHPESHAVIHTHSIHSTALACLEKPIPAFHYMVAVAGGSDIPCAPYATFGTERLSRQALTALKNRKACLLAHHGLLCREQALDKALALAIEVETLAHTYLLCLQTGSVNILPEDEMDKVLDKFKGYGPEAQKSHINL